MSGHFEYKGYIGSAEVSVEDSILVGRLLFIRDTIGYSATSVADLEKAFREAVDEYLRTCAELGDEPDTPCKGTFNVRVGPQRHRDIAMAARRRGVGLNEYVCLALDEVLSAETAPSPRTGVEPYPALNLIQGSVIRSAVVANPYQFVIEDADTAVPWIQDAWLSRHIVAATGKAEEHEAFDLGIATNWDDIGGRDTEKQH